jgi:hypothetical protein
MADLILSDAQAKIVVATGSALSVRDESGHLLGYLSPLQKDPHFSDDDIEAAKAALREPGPRFTTAQVLEHLRSLEPS